MIQGILGLSIRAPEPIRPAFVAKMSPRHVSKWLETLPIANISDSSRRLYQMLLDCNKSALSDDDRFKILQILHPAVQLVLKSLSKHFTGHTLNLSDKQKKIAALVQALHTEMAIGFKIIIEHQVESPSLLKKSMLHAALFLALEYLSLTIVRCYQVYTDIPQRLWKEINTIYRYSLEQKLQDKTCQFNGFQQEHSISDVFMKICLLSIANAYQLRQQEIELVFNGLQKYVGHCELEMSNRFDNRFVIDLNLARPPLHQALVKTRPSQFTFALNLDSVVQELQNALKETKSDRERVAIGGLSIRLIRHLLKSWAHMSSRNFARTHCEGNIKISVGLTATCQILLGPEDDEPIETLDKLEGSLHNATLLHDDDTAQMFSNFGNDNIVTQRSEEDVWAKLYRPKQAIPVNTEVDYAQAFKGKQQTDIKGDYQLIAADIVNISPGGYCIELGDQPPQQTQTGEVIGVVEYEANGQESWQIGVIRWIKRSKTSPAVQLGVQLIAPGGKPIQSQLKNSNLPNRSFQNALLLPELKGIGQPATIITNPVLYNPKQKITVIDGEDVFEAQLTKLVSSSQGYRQFYFDRLDYSGSKPNKPAKNLGPTTDGFDNVWDLI